MIIKSIQLSNIRSYTNTTIEFEDGINFLSGDIGCGKSSILLAIEFALFGFKKGDIEGFQLLRKGENEGFVKLILVNPKNQTQNLEIFRKIKMSKTGTISQDAGHILSENSLQELSPQELNYFIFEKLNFPKEFLTKDKNLVYRFTIYTPQEQLKEVLFATEEKRLEIIRKIFRIDKYKQLVTANNHYLSDLKVDKKIISSKLDGFENITKNLEQINLSILDFKEKLNNIKEKEKHVTENKQKIKLAITKLEITNESLNEKKLKTEKNLSLVQEIKNSLQSLTKENEIIKLTQKEYSLDNIEIKRTQLNTNLENINLKIKQIQVTKQISTNLNKNFDTLSKQKEKIITELNQQKSNQKLLETYNNQFDIILTKCNIKDNEVLLNKTGVKLRKAEKLQKKYEDLNKNLIKNKIQIDHFKKEIETKQIFIDKFESLEDCPTCMQKVSKIHTHTISQNQLKEIEDLIKTKTNLRIEIKNQITDLDKLKLQVQDLKLQEVNFIKFEQIDKQLKEKYNSELKLEILKIELKNKLEKTKESNHNKNLDSINENLEILSIEKLKLEKLSIQELEYINKASNEKEEINKLNIEIKTIELKETQLKDNESKIITFTKKIEIESKLKENQKLINDRLIELKEKKLIYSKKFEIVLDNEIKISNILTTITTQLEFKTKELETKNKQKSEFEIEQNNLKLLIKKENFISQKVTPIAQNIEKAVFTKYYVEFNEIFEKLFKELIEDNEIEVRLNEIFSIIVEQNGFDIDIKNLSGGEKSSLAVAYRLGLKQIIENNLQGENKLDLLILDEPTDGFSNEQVTRLGNILKNSDLKQTILVSHDEKIESIADYTIKVEKENHVSKLI